MNLRTDLAFESRNFYLTENKKNEIDGIEFEEKVSDLYKVTRVKIKDDESGKKIGKPRGTYITIHSSNIKSGLYQKELSEVFARELKTLFPKNKNPLFFVASLGNDNVTPDALGPFVSEGLIITRHIISRSEIGDLASLSTLAPGVLGITGIESADIFSSVIEKIKPDVVIAIDALASALSSNVGTTIQISDSGISPGSGVNNRRNALNEKTLGVPVIAVGMPTVSDASSVVISAIKKAISLSGKQIDNDEYIKIAEEVLTEHNGEMMVTPKDIDSIIKRASLIISRGLNMAIHNLSFADVLDYTN